MSCNILIGGAAGQGMETLAFVLEKILKRKGFYTYTTRDYMSRVRGGHNFIQVRFADHPLHSHWDDLDGIIALNKETIDTHIHRLSSNGFIISDEEISYEDSRVVRLPLKDHAKQIGNPRVFGNVALGAVLRLFGLDLSKVEEVVSQVFRPELAVPNVTAFHAGFSLVSPRYSFIPAGEDNSILINGNEAVALGAIAADCKFYSAYPMTPSTSIMTYLAQKGEHAEVLVEQAEDEIAAINMAIGASYAGVRAMTGSSGGGFALMVEAVGLSGMMELPLVIAEVQRPGPVTGLPTRTEQADLKFIVSCSHGEFPRMVIALRNAEEAFAQTVRAFHLADKYQIPVFVVSDQYVADTTVTIPPFDLEKVEIHRFLSNEEFAGEKEYKRYEITASGVSPRITPGKVPGKTILVDSDEHDEYGRITESAEVRIRMNDKRMRKLNGLMQEAMEPVYLGAEHPEVLLVAWGSTYGPVREAVERLNTEPGKQYGALVFGDIWPLPEKKLRELAVKVPKIINVEQNATGQLASIIREVTGIQMHDSLLKYDGRQISSQEIYNTLKGGAGV